MVDLEGSWGSHGCSGIEHHLDSVRGETERLGARLELFYEGGWWPVTVLEKKPADAQLASGPRLHVQAVGYDVKSWAGLSAFRLPSAA